MTPIQKAKELIYEFEEKGIDIYDSVQYALIVVNEILNIDNIKPYILHKEIIEFYQEVKQEIEKI